MEGGIEFQVAGIPVKVLYMFLFVAVLFGYRLNDPMLIAAWVVIMFASILLHELGHAFAYRHFGVQPSIVLHGFGGLTFGRSLPVRHDLLVTIAGPGAGLAVGLPLLYVYRSVPVHDPFLANVLWMAVFINVVWSILNLLPMMPLDGGNATNALLTLAFRRDMTRTTRVLSIITAAAAIAFALQYRFLYGAALAAYFLYVNVQGLRNTPSIGRFQPTITTPRGRTRPARPPRRQRTGKGSSGADRPQEAIVPPVSWSPSPPERPPSSPISTVGWAQPSGARRSFGQEVDTAAQALGRGEPELAAIAVDRARRLAGTADEITVVEHLQAEVDRHIAGPH